MIILREEITRNQPAARTANILYGQLMFNPTQANFEHDASIIDINVLKRTKVHLSSKRLITVVTDSQCARFVPYPRIFEPRSIVAMFFYVLKVIEF